MSHAIDILGLGCVAVDDLLYVASYPPADSKTPVQRRERHCGGLTATALVAAARMGAQCSYAGVLGQDELSHFVLERMKAEGIDVAHAARRPDVQPIHSIVIVEEGRGTRTIFYDLHGVAGPDETWPTEDVIRAARLLFVDQLGTEGMHRAAGIAHAAGLPVVADFESDEGPMFAELLNLVDHLIISRAFAAKLTGLAEPAAAAVRLGAGERQAVVLTDGAAGCWYWSGVPRQPARHQRAFAVQAVDTTGCGDVFHGAYAAALVAGMSLEERVRFAAAAAALKATQRGGQAGIPNRAAVEAFLRDCDS